MTERLAGHGIRDSAFDDERPKKKRKKVFVPSAKRLLRQSERRLHRGTPRMSRG